MARGLTALILAAAVAGPAAILAQSESIPTLVRLHRVRFVGLSRFTPEQVLAAAGLRHGDSLSDVEFRDLSRRLLRTGLFEHVGSRYLITGLDVEITFDVEETPWDVPLLFDNFVWFTDEELLASIAERVPTFDGKAPATGRVLRRIAEALQALRPHEGIP